MPEVRQVGHDGDQLVRVNRFWDVHLETGRQRANAIFDPGEGGQRDGWNIPSVLGAALAYTLDQFVPILLWHGEVRNKRVRTRAFESCERVVGRGCGDDLGAAVLENDFEHLERIQIVIDHQYTDTTQVLLVVHLTGLRRLFQRWSRSPYFRSQDDVP